MAQYDTFASDTPIVCNPRDPFKEPILNIAALLEEYLSIPLRQKEFAPPFLRRVNRGAYYTEPVEWPCCDIRFFKKVPYGKNDKELGCRQVRTRMKCHYIIRYFHASLDQPLDDMDVTTNLYRIVDLLEYRNDVHGFAPRERAEIGTVTQDASIFALFANKGWVAGGAIEYVVPVVADRTYYDAGQTARSVVMASGAAH